MDRLLKESNGQIGRIKANAALNGSSATVTLRDDRLPESFSGKFWEYAVDLAKGWSHRPDRRSDNPTDDTYDDLGSDDPERTAITRSGVRRNGKVRQAVRKRAQGACEQCGTMRSFPGFLDVHHVLGAEKSDRPWTCVAICPNCHREAHFSPDAETIQAKLLGMASRFR